MSKYHPQNYGEDAERRPSPKQNEYSPLESLQELAEDRGAEPELRSLVGLARKLENWPWSEVREACIALGKRERREGEPAFPPLGAIIEELKRLGSNRASQTATERSNAELEQFFWEHIDYKVETFHLTEQQALDTIQQPGFVGRKAATRPPTPKSPYCGDCFSGLMRYIQPNGDFLMRTCQCVGGRG
jgi:hypothetical protein